MRGRGLGPLNELDGDSVGVLDEGVEAHASGKVKWFLQDMASSLAARRQDAAQVGDLEGEVIEHALLVRGNLEGRLPVNTEDLDLVAAAGLKECDLQIPLSDRLPPYEFHAQYLRVEGNRSVHIARSDGGVEKAQSQSDKGAFHRYLAGPSAHEKGQIHGLPMESLGGDGLAW